MWIRPDIYWVDAGSSNTYLCRDVDGWTLIDTGMPRTARLILDVLTTLDANPSDLKRIVLTHADLDHAGGLAEVQRQTGAEVWAGSETARFLAAGMGPEHMPGPIQFLADRFARYRPFPRDQVQIFQDDQRLSVLGGLIALATPGHTLDHFSFYAPAQRVVFAGDALNTRLRRLRGTPARITADRAAARRSAARLLDLDPVVIAAGHGPPRVTEDAEARARDYGEFRQTIGQ